MNPKVSNVTTRKLSEKTALEAKVVLKKVIFNLLIFRQQKP